MLNLRRKYLFVQDQEIPRTNKTIKAPLFGLSKRYVKLDETYTTSLSKADKHFRFLGWSWAGSEPWINMTIEERVAILDN